VKETNPTLVGSDVTELLERARRACEEAVKLSGDYLWADRPSMAKCRLKIILIDA